MEIELSFLYVCTFQMHHCNTIGSCVLILDPIFTLKQWVLHCAYNYIHGNVRTKRHNSEIVSVIPIKSDGQCSYFVDSNFFGSD